MAAIVFGTSATDAGQHLIYDSVQGALYYDVDGNGSAAQVLIARSAHHAALTAADFELI